MARETRRLDKVVGGTTGMAIISEGIAYVCEEVGVDKFRLMQQPGFLVNSEQRMFELVKEDYFYGKEEKRNKKYNWFIALIVFQVMIVNMFLLTKIGGSRLRVGVTQILYGSSVLFNVYLFNKIKIKRYEVEGIIARKKCALYKVLNSWDKLGREPSLEEAKIASSRPTAITAVSPFEVSAMIMIAFGINTIISNIIISMPLTMVLTVCVIKFRVCNIFERGKMCNPTERELKEAMLLVSFYNETSN